MNVSKNKYLMFYFCSSFLKILAKFLRVTSLYPFKSLFTRRHCSSVQYSNYPSLEQYVKFYCSTVQYCQIQSTSLQCCIDLYRAVALCYGNCHSGKNNSNRNQIRYIEDRYLVLVTLLCQLIDRPYVARTVHNI